jgi:3-oxoadipate enol-lactonase
VKNRPDVTDAVRAMVRGTPVKGYIACCQAIAQLNLADRLPGIALPTLIIADEDDPTTVEMARTINRGIPGSERWRRQRASV